MKITLEIAEINQIIQEWGVKEFPNHDVVLKRQYMLSGEIDLELTNRIMSTPPLPVAMSPTAGDDDVLL